jgi:hypothetical protein
MGSVDKRSASRLNCAKKNISDFYLLSKLPTKSPLFIAPGILPTHFPLTSIKQNISSEPFFSTEKILCKKYIKNIFQLY